MLPSLAVAAVLGIGGVSAGAVLYSGGSHEPAGTLPRAVPTVAASSPPSPASPTGPSAPMASSTPAVRPSATTLPDFALTVVGHVSWVSVVGPHGHVLYAGLLRHGRTLSYSQRPLTVTLGDAGAVRLIAHHKVRAHAGHPGQVLRFTYR